MFAATQPTPIRPTPGGSLCTLQAHLSRQIQKTNPLCKHFSTSESAPNTLHTKSTLTTLQKRRARANAPVTAQARRQKDQPRHFNRRQKTHPTPRKQIVMGADMRQCEPNTHISSMRDGQRKLRIDRPSKLFHKIVKQARKNIWTRRKTPLRASAWAVACYGTLFANMCIIRTYLEIIWLDFDRSCPYCSL